LGLKVKWVVVRAAAGQWKAPGYLSEADESEIWRWRERLRLLQISRVLCQAFEFWREKDMLNLAQTKTSTDVDDSS